MNYWFTTHFEYYSSWTKKKKTWQEINDLCRCVSSAILIWMRRQYYVNGSATCLSTTLLLFRVLARTVSSWSTYEHQKWQLTKSGPSPFYPNEKKKKLNGNMNTANHGCLSTGIHTYTSIYLSLFWIWFFFVEILTNWNWMNHIESRIQHGFSNE